MRFFILIISLFLLAGCSSSDRLLKDATPPPTNIGNEKQAAQTPSQNENAEAVTPTPQNKKPMYQNPPALTINKSKKYSATFTTTKGTIEVELFAASTPITVNNFIFLAREKFYDGVTFHRTIPGFMIQGGDPTGTGSGGPGYQFADEAFSGEYTRGTLAMANAGPDTNGSQFFIMQKDNALPKNYVIFGKVTSGLEVVDAIATAPTVASGEGSQPQNPVTIQSVTIFEK